MAVEPGAPWGGPGGSEGALLQPSGCGGSWGGGGSWEESGPFKGTAAGIRLRGPPSRLQGAGSLALDATRCEPQAGEGGSAWFPLSLIFFEASI